MKVNTNFIILMLLIFSISFSSAFLGFFEQGECVELKTISNSSFVNLSSVSNLNEQTFFNQQMTKNGKTFNFTFCATNTTGNYNYDFFDAEGNVFVNNFEITPTGRDFSTGQSTVSIGILFGALIVAFLLLAIGLFLWTHEGNTALGFLFFAFSILFGIYSLHLSFAYASDILFYDSLTPVVSVMYTSFLWIMTGIAIISFALLLIAFIKELGKMNDSKQFGENFDPITETYKF